MTFSFKRRLLTTDEYHQMAEVGILTQEDKVELIEGQLVEMSPIGSQHAAYVNKLNAILVRLLPEKYIISVQNPIVVNTHSEPEPDIAVLKPDDNLYEHQLPGAKDVLLVIEIADTSLDYDREIKLPLYASTGIPEYWIVDLQHRQIEVHHSPLDNQYRYREIVNVSGNLHFHTLSLDIPANKILG